jgi:hypothetical protein
MAWAWASMSGGGAMASLLASSSVAAIFTPSLGLQRRVNHTNSGKYKDGVGQGA